MLLNSSSDRSRQSSDTLYRLLEHTHTHTQTLLQLSTQVCWHTRA